MMLESRREFCEMSENTSLFCEMPENTSKFFVRCVSNNKFYEMPERIGRYTLMSQIGGNKDRDETQYFIYSEPAILHV